MKYLGCFQVEQKVEICCCSTKTGLFIFAILMVLNSLITMIRSPDIKVICLYSLNFIPALMLIYCSIKKDKGTVKVATILHSVFTGFFLGVAIVITINFIANGLLSDPGYGQIALEILIAIWISSFLNTYANYVFTCFCNNYDQIMGQSEVSSTDPLNSYQNFNQTAGNSV